MVKQRKKSHPTVTNCIVACARRLLVQHLGEFIYVLSKEEGTAGRRVVNHLI